ncbi:MAG: nuclear transport factor 2 family protein [Gammaproteobacteria bacterium]|nr:nuclear transport factor 2 family protein [Gammaproteobacteria bacterium]
MDNTLITNFVENINSISSVNVSEILEKIYTDEIEFIDPVKDIRGIGELTSYFSSLYKSVDHCHFTIKDYISNDNQHSLEWEMKLKHRRLAKNKEISLHGASFIRFEDNKVCYHRDYYDLGALIYERIPILGSAVRTVRNAF